MPKYKFSMILSSANVQTTAEPRFRAMRKTNPNFNMGGGCCNKNRNPLKGWRKEGYCCPCRCTQMISSSTIPVSSLPTSGTITSWISSASGIIIASDPELGGDGRGGVLVVLLDDCKNPFTSRDGYQPPPATGLDEYPLMHNGIAIGEIRWAISNATKQCTPATMNTSIRWQSIIKNVDNCCRSHKKMIQNRAASSPAQTKANGGVAYRVSGKIDKKYNHNYRQYLKKRCMLPDYYNATGAKKKTFSRVTGHNQYQAPCCGTDCSNGITPPTSTNLHWKRSNWGFYKQGAVDNDIYIAL